MKLSRQNLISLFLIGAALALSAFLYARLPDPMPTHWNLQGEVNGYTAKPWGPLVIPLIMIGVMLLFLALPKLSPRGYEIGRFQGVFEILQTVSLAFLLLVHAMTLLFGIGVAVDMTRAIIAALGLLFAILGNFLGKVTKNFFVGIRTPWTLASDEVWLRTHRLAGKLFVLAGILLFVWGLAGGAFAVVIAVPLAAALYSVVYSYFLYRRLEGSAAESGGGSEASR
jgi:uncharacterized membrane protein